MLTFDKPFCKIYYYEDIKTVHIDWGKFAKKEQFIEACDFSLELLSKNKVSKMIADNSKASVVAVENQNWLTENWFPRALEKGFRYSAVVLSDDTFIKYAVKKIENKINDELFVVQYFNSVDNAREWLRSVN
jgi:hypothetical protein